MDCVRSTNDLEISEVIQSFSGINTPRSCKSSFHVSLGQTSESARLEACRLLQDREMDGLQPEIKAALRILMGKRIEMKAGLKSEICKSLLITKLKTNPAL